MDEFLIGDAVWRPFLSSLERYAVVLLDRDGHVASWNEGARLLKGYERDEAIGLHFSAFYTAEAVALGHPQRELAVAASLGRYEEEGWRVRKDTSLFWAHVVITAIFDDRMVLRGFGKVIRDSTQQKQSAEQTANILNLLELAARCDYLTGLDNRRALDIALHEKISSSSRHGRPLCLAMIDLDRFKDFNDTHGHQAGDVYLKQVAGVWRRTLRPADFICRYGGEEFVVGLPDTPLAEAVACLERLRTSTLEPLTCSIGVAEWIVGETASELIGRADACAYEAKRTGRDRLCTSSGKPAGTTRPSRDDSPLA